MLINYQPLPSGRYIGGIKNIIPILGIEDIIIKI